MSQPVVSRSGPGSSVELIRHVVLLQFRDSIAPSEVAWFDRQLDRFQDADGAPSVVRHDLGLRPGHPRAFNRLVEFEFPDSSSFDAYIAGRAHQRFLAGPIRLACRSVASIQVTTARQGPNT